MSTNGELQVDLDVKYRPACLDDVVGQPDAVETIRSWGMNVPRAILLHGLTGTGKTTIARIIAHDILKVVPVFDYREINCGSVKHITEMVRDLEVEITASSLKPGGKRVWVLDEVQTFSKSRGAQEALLKVMEDAKPHVTIILCTTDPRRMLATIRGRCNQIALRALRVEELAKLVRDIAASEKVKLDDRLVDRIVDVAGGSARNAIKELEKVIRIDDPAKRLAVVGGVGVQKVASDLIAELLPFKGSANWTGVARVLEDCKDEEPEGIRQMLLAVARGMLLKGGNRASLGYKVITCFNEPLYDRNSGHAMLAASCWEVVNG